MTSFLSTALRISAGVIVWAVHFGLVYGVTAIACARGNPAAVPWAIAIPTLAAGVLVIAIFAREWKRREAFESWLAATLAAVALLAIVLEALPVLIVPPCD